MINSTFLTVRPKEQDQLWALPDSSWVGPVLLLCHSQCVVVMERYIYNQKTREVARLPPLTHVAVGRPLTLSKLVSLPIKWRSHILCLLLGLKRDNYVK